jgi:hypothetical protein
METETTVAAPIPKDKPLAFRPPSTSPAKDESSTTWTNPSMEFLQGSWHVTHSTLPMWKSNRNVVITYTALSDPPGAIDDLVEYQPLKSDKQKTVRGVDTPDPAVPAAYNWRGKGWLMIASSHWEVLGWGDEDEGWVVTFFAKTLFTPAGIDIYARKKGGLSENLLERIRAQMKQVDDASFNEQAETIFEIHHDW